MLAGVVVNDLVPGRGGFVPGDTAKGDLRVQTGKGRDVEISGYENLRICTMKGTSPSITIIFKAWSAGNVPAGFALTLPASVGSEANKRRHLPRRRRHCECLEPHSVVPFTSLRRQLTVRRLAAALDSRQDIEDPTLFYSFTRSPLLSSILGLDAARFR